MRRTRACHWCSPGLRKFAISLDFSGLRSAQWAKFGPINLIHHLALRRKSSETIGVASLQILGQIPTIRIRNA